MLHRLIVQLKAKNVLNTISMHFLLSSCLKMEERLVSLVWFCKTGLSEKLGNLFIPEWQQLIWLYSRRRKHVPCFYRVIETRVEVWENEKFCGNTSRRRVFPQLFRVPPNFHKCFYNSIETRRTCFLFRLENTVTKKRKTTNQHAYFLRTVF